MKNVRLLLVGNGDPVHVGAHFEHAANQLGIEHVFVDVKQAYRGLKTTTRINWWLRGRRPNRLNPFCQDLVDGCRAFQPTHFLTTGIAPVNAKTLASIGGSGVVRMNFLTDDPWNPAHRAPWFMKALNEYDIVFTPRAANIGDLESLRSPSVAYLPFGYNEAVHFPETPADEVERAALTVDVLFAGGADRDRVPYARALADAGFSLALYGGYWDRYPELKPFHRGMADARLLRKAVGCARLTLCLVRRANRDSHCMRTFETPAMKGCMLTERTADHEKFFGPDDKAVAFFGSTDDLIEKARHLLAYPDEVDRIKENAYRLITTETHKYSDRLVAMLTAAFRAKAYA